LPKIQFFGVPGKKKQKTVFWAKLFLGYSFLKRFLTNLKSVPNFFCTHFDIFEEKIPMDELKNVFCKYALLLFLYAIALLYKQ